MYPKIIQVLFHIKVMMKTYLWDWKDFIFTGWDSRIPFLRGQMNFSFDQKRFSWFSNRIFWVARISFCLIPFAIDWYFIFYDAIPRLLIFFPINMWYQFLSLLFNSRLKLKVQAHDMWILSANIVRKGDLLKMFAKSFRHKLIRFIFLTL